MGVMAAESLQWRDLLFSFEGRISRRIFVTRCMFAKVFTGTLIGLALFIVMQAVDMSRGRTGGAIWVALASLPAAVLIVFLVWMNIATTVKRLHDRGRSGWLTLLLLVPLVNLWILLETYFLRGKAEPNKFGASSSAKAEHIIVSVCLGIVAITLESYFSLIMARSFVLQTFDIP